MPDTETEEHSIEGSEAGVDDTSENSADAPSGRIRSGRVSRRAIVAGGLTVGLVMCAAGAAFAAPLLLPRQVSAATPAPTSISTPSPTPTPTPTPTPADPVEPHQLRAEQNDSDLVPGEVTGPFDRSSTRLVGTDGTVLHYVARGVSAAAPYCLILISTDGLAGWAVGCGTLAGTRAASPVVGESQLSAPGSAPTDWRSVDEFVSVNPEAARIAVEFPGADIPPDTAPYSVDELQAALDAIGPDVVVPWTGQPLVDYTDSQNNHLRSDQTAALVAEAALRLGGPVAVIRPTFVGFPDDTSDSPNSLLWWVVMSEPTQFQFSYMHQVDGRDWSGWAQGDRDLGALERRVRAWLAENQPGVDWTIVTQSH